MAPPLDGLSVERTDRVPNSDLPEIYARASVLLVPSYAEAQPLVWLEAMASGLPVIAYDRPWAREVVVHGETGLLVEPGDVAALADATSTLLSAHDRRSAMGLAAAARVRERFDIERVATQLAAVLERAVGGRPLVHP